MVIRGWPFENRVIDAWHAIQYYLPRAITVMGKRNIYIICNQFIVVKHVHVHLVLDFLKVVRLVFMIALRAHSRRATCSKARLVSKLSLARASRSQSPRYALKSSTSEQV